MEPQGSSLCSQAATKSPINVSAYVCYVHGSLNTQKL